MMANKQIQPVQPETRSPFFTMPSSLDGQSDQSAKTAAMDPLGAQRTQYKPGITFASQDKLPKLPIPDLDASCRKYLEALRPLQSGREHNDTRAAVEDFLKSEGPELQERLKKYATGKTSYIEQFCMLFSFPSDCSC